MISFWEQSLWHKAIVKVTFCLSSISAVYSLYKLWEALSFPHVCVAISA